MEKIVAIRDAITRSLDDLGEWLPHIPLRLILAWEFYESGVVKLQGNNWFGDIQDSFVFPFSAIPAGVSWFLATWTELLGSICLLIGLFTRFWSLALIILTVVAIGAVHWPDDWSSLQELWKGYAVTNKGFGNYKLPLLFIVLLLPLLFGGAGKASLDYFITQSLRR